MVAAALKKTYGGILYVPQINLFLVGSSMSFSKDTKFYKWPHCPILK